MQGFRQLKGPDGSIASLVTGQSGRIERVSIWLLGELPQPSEILIARDEFQHQWFLALCEIGVRQPLADLQRLATRLHRRLDLLILHVSPAPFGRLEQAVQEIILEPWTTCSPPILYSLAKGNIVLTCGTTCDGMEDLGSHVFLSVSLSHSACNRTIRQRFKEEQESLNTIKSERMRQLVMRHYW